MSITLTVEKYDSMQAELTKLRTEVGAYKEGKHMITTCYTRFSGRYEKVYATQEIIDGLNQELIEIIGRLEDKIPDIKQVKTGGWWRGLRRK